MGGPGSIGILREADAAASEIFDHARIVLVAAFQQASSRVVRAAAAATPGSAAGGAPRVSE